MEVISSLTNSIEVGGGASRVRKIIPGTVLRNDSRSIEGVAFTGRSYSRGRLVIARETLLPRRIEEPAAA
jgi:hypothetical protein